MYWGNWEKGLFKQTAEELRGEWLGRMFEGAGLEIERRAGRELGELVAAVKYLAILHAS